MAHQIPAVEFVFVYGTLRRDAASPMHNILTENSDYFGEGFIQAELYEIDHYPGAVESGNKNDLVKGEIYKINNPELLFLQLDEYEGCSADFAQPHQYLRKQLPVYLERPTDSADRERVIAWVYIYNHDVSGLWKIGSGDYLDFFG